MRPTPLAKPIWMNPAASFPRAGAIPTPCGADQARQVTELANAQGRLVSAELQVAAAGPRPKHDVDLESSLGCVVVGRGSRAVLCECRLTVAPGSAEF